MSITYFTSTTFSVYYITELFYFLMCTYTFIYMYVYINASVIGGGVLMTSPQFVLFAFLFFTQFYALNLNDTIGRQHL